MATYRTIVVPFDFSPHASRALERAHDLARQLGADVHLLHVVEPPSAVYGYPGFTPVPPSPMLLDMREVKQGAIEALRDLAARLDPLPGKLACHVIEGAQVAEAICGFAEANAADLLVMGTHGRTGLSRVFLGSVAERTLRGAPCPVLMVRTSEEDERSWSSREAGSSSRPSST
jgi:nucleotide-binding universal stress UspA family protein